ncbi:ligase-associated DNA damage response DEXH box helicase [Maioricimonas rarisocia]
MWNAYLDGQSGLLHSSTGTGKTLAAWMGPLIESLAESRRKPGRSSRRAATEPLRVLWITPLRALAADTANALQRPLDDLEIDWTLETRTGDTSSSVRARQRRRLPTALITTPESLSLLLTRADAREQFASLRTVIVDEWHELLSTKRGVQTELALARLRRWSPPLRVWGLSATLGNLDEALRTLQGSRVIEGDDSANKVIAAPTSKRFRVDTLIPATIERFPWAGHMGLRQLESVASELDSCRSALVFTNTRFQAEQWYQALLQARPHWAGEIALHHGSLDQQTRGWVEDGLRQGTVRCVVCTSSLDLGVDFSPVERVLQVGSPKGVARLLQRAGRSGHQPGAVSRVSCVPTHAFELIEFAAARDAIEAGKIERRRPVENPIDVLVQHAATIALGSGFDADDLLDEVRTTHSFRSLHEDDWEWVLDFVTRGGEALRAYPDYHRVQFDGEKYRLLDKRLARQHRMSIGTIVADAALTVRYLKGPRLGTVEESFISRLQPGDHFTFAGRSLELVKVHDMEVLVRRSKRVGGRIPRWMGGRMPLSTELARAVRGKLEEALHGEFRGPEMQAVRPLLELQTRWSRLPAADELLIERITTREGHHLFIYPFAGRLVHEGLAPLLAWRMSRLAPITFAMSVNDYGLELLSSQPAPFEQALDCGLLSTDSLADDIAASLNAAEMGKRQFREIARIAGLVFEGYPGSRKSTRQLQASTGLLYDVFSNYDPGNLLLRQARVEVLERQLEHRRIHATLDRLQQSRLVLSEPSRPTPLAFPLLVDRLRERLSSEKLADRVKRLQQSLEKAAGR